MDKAGVNVTMTETFSPSEKQERDARRYRALRDNGYLGIDKSADDIDAEVDELMADLGIAYEEMELDG